MPPFGNMKDTFETVGLELSVLIKFANCTRNIIAAAMMTVNQKTLT